MTFSTIRTIGDYEISFNDETKCWAIADFIDCNCVVIPEDQAREIGLMFATGNKSQTEEEQELNWWVECARRQEEAAKGDLTFVL